MVTAALATLPVLHEGLPPAAVIETVPPVVFGYTVTAADAVAGAEHGELEQRTTTVLVIFEVDELLATNVKLVVPETTNNGLQVVPPSCDTSYVAPDKYGFQVA